MCIMSTHVACYMLHSMLHSVRPIKPSDGNFPGINMYESSFPFLKMKCVGGLMVVFLSFEYNKTSRKQHVDTMNARVVLDLKVRSMDIS